MPPLPKKPIDELRSMAAPRELIDWVRKLNPEDVLNQAWTGVTRADWIPFLAVLRGVSKEACIRATCACARDLAAPALTEAPGDRVLAILRDSAENSSVLKTAEQQLEDLRIQMIQHGEANQPPWMQWCKLTLELGRAAQRNPLIGVTLVLKFMAGLGGRRGASELVTRYREALTAAG